MASEILKYREPNDEVYQAVENLADAAHLNRSDLLYLWVREGLEEAGWLPKARDPELMRRGRVMRQLQGVTMEAPADGNGLPAQQLADSLQDAGPPIDDVLGPCRVCSRKVVEGEQPLDLPADAEPVHESCLDDRPPEVNAFTADDAPLYQGEVYAVRTIAKRDGSTGYGIHPAGSPSQVLYEDNDPVLTNRKAAIADAWGSWSGGRDAGKDAGVGAFGLWPSPGDTSALCSECPTCGAAKGRECDNGRPHGARLQAEVRRVTHSLNNAFVVGLRPQL